MLELAIHLGSMRNSVNADDFLFVINPIKNAPVSHAQLAQTGQVVRHADEAPMNHYGSVLHQPDELIFNCGTDGRIQFLQLRIHDV